MGTTYHSNKKTKWIDSTNTAYHDNGKTAYIGSTGTAYHDNGKTAYIKSTGTAYIASTNTFYDSDGKRVDKASFSISLGKGITLNIIPNIKVTVYGRKISD